MIKLSSRSIRFRLTAWYAAVLAFTFFILGIGVWIALRHSTRVTVDKELRSRLRTVRVYIDRQAPDGDVSHLLEELNEQAVMTPAATNLRIADVSGKWIYQSPGSEQWAVSLSKREDLQTINVRGKPLRILIAPVKIGTVEIALPLGEFEEMQRDFLWTAGLGSPLLLLFASAGGYWMSGRALRPVDEIAVAARRISANNLSERLPSHGTGDELDRLSQVLNGMLARLEAAFKQIKQFTADASHELRTPVAIIRTTAEVTKARERSVEEHLKAWETVVAQTERTSQLIDDLLILARADAASESLSFESMDLAETVREACSEMQVIAEADGLPLSSCVPSHYLLVGDQEAIRRALLILLDNAIKFTQPPGRVFVSLEVEDGMAVVQVKDTGIGISEGDLPYIFNRFYRAAKDRSRKTGGAGLGLSIALWIAAQHGGKILAESTVGAGSTFRLVIPSKS